MEGELALLLMAVFFRFVTAPEREGSDEHQGGSSPGRNEKDPMFRVLTYSGPTEVGPNLLLAHLGCKPR